jgi:hypothetical protein
MNNIDKVFNALPDGEELKAELKQLEDMRTLHARRQSEVVAFYYIELIRFWEKVAVKLEEVISENMEW